jgi:hypothetical protein
MRMSIKTLVLSLLIPLVLAPFAAAQETEAAGAEETPAAATDTIAEPATPEEPVTESIDTEVTEEADADITEDSAEEVSDFERRLDFHGSYFRTTYMYFNRPYAQREAEYAKGVSYMRHRLHIAPVYQINEKVELHAEIDTFINHRDALDLDENLTKSGVWGAADGTVLQQNTESQNANIILRRLYGKVTLPFGLLEFGRMPSQLGMGLMSNGGNGPQLFGENNFGDTYDRLLFATRPFGSDSDLILAFMYDKIIEGDLGLVGSTTDDLEEYNFVIANNSDDVFVAAAYFIYRVNPDTDTKAAIPILYFKMDLDVIRAEVEALWVKGSTRSAPKIDQFEQPEISLPTTELDMVAYVARFGLGQMLLDPIKMLQFEWGEVSGDKRPFDPTFDKKFNSFILDPDFNVGLIMWEEAFARKSLQVYRDKVDLVENTLIDLDYVEEGSEEHEALLSSSSMLYTEGGVTNCMYLYPSIQVAVTDDITLKMAYLTAWAKYAYDTNLDDRPDATFYGRELDWGFEYLYEDHLRFVGEFGYFWPGDVFDEPQFYVDPETGDRVFTGLTNHADEAFTSQLRLEVLF